MSETAKSREVEDVLSSIRRLVSDEPTTAVAERPACLLLTPALRVPPEPATPEPDANGTRPALRLDQAQRADAAPARGPRETWPLFLTEPQPPESAEPVRASEADDCDAATLEQRIAELEAAVAGCDDDWEPDGTEALAAATGWGRPDRAAPAGETDVPPAEVPPQANDDIADTVLIDEEMLRDLVTEVVRGELQGALGERITRNVRKLVRREVSRALAARDLE
ncbi:hypothetical protein SAMN05444722_1414 [Rhodovulum sp. ES.010]|nr:hypothetical protein SAMN05444722_1414 [Rhodovulum sp. ES.010]